MISNLIDKITRKSKQFLLQASRDYQAQKKSCVPYEELIVTNEKYPDYYFLVHKNMIFDKGSICDTSYNVYSFDKDGEYVKKEEMDLDFFRTNKVIKII
jgi:hypothetical protein